MGHAKTAEIAFDPEIYSRLEQRARTTGQSIGDVIRQAVTDSLQKARSSDPRAAYRRIVSMELDVSDWEEMEEEIVDARASGLR